jgi:hypothetical protein
MSRTRIRVAVRVRRDLPPGAIVVAAMAEFG